MAFPTDENVLVGLDRADDAGVYKVSDDLALIQTVDFFTPIVDDPYMFGQIAAANALSDIYAMGGVPKTAMNLVAFPAKDMAFERASPDHPGGNRQAGGGRSRPIGRAQRRGQGVEVRPVGDGFCTSHPGAHQEKSAAGRQVGAHQTAGYRHRQYRHQSGHGAPALTDTVTRLMATLNREAAGIMTHFT